MNAKEKRKIRNGEDVDHLFPRMIGEDILIKNGATVEDTVEFIPTVVHETLEDTAKIAKDLKGKSLFDTCKNIWHFVYGYIAYEKDEKGKEEIRRPARSWSNRFRGVDCDDYTVFISSILTNLSIPHLLRIAKYYWTQGKFAHIYPVVTAPGGTEIIIDCVVDRFDYQEPFTEKKDKRMDLYYLNGIDRPATVDADDLTQGGMADLGKIKILQKVGAAIKKTVHAVNVVNPATLLLRAGVLASMKLNVFGVAEKIRFAYLSDADAQKRGYDMAKFAKLKTVREKLEKIFYGAGGKQENLKEAILTGKGNASKEVSGLFGNELDMPLRDVIGQRAFTTEVEAVEGLGEPTTAAALAAASAIMASLAAIIKGIGNFKGGGAAAPTTAEIPQEVLPTNIAPDPVSYDTTDTSAIDPGLFTESDNTPVIQTRSADVPADSSQTDTSNTDTTNTDNSNKKSPDDKDATWWTKNKSWALPTGIGIGVVSLALVGYSIARPKNDAKQHRKPSNAMAGVKRKKTRKRKKSSGKKVQAVRWR